MEDKDENKIFKEILEWCFCILFALVIALLTRFYIGAPTIVKQASMYPTLQENQRIFLSRVKRITKGEYKFSNLNEILPKYITESLKEAIEYFDTKIKGYSRNDAILLGVESRTSSPVRIERSEEGLSNVIGIYPCGEGAGYAGGITTAAMDGIKIAEQIATIYKPYKEVKYETSN